MAHIKAHKSFNLLDDPCVVQWCYEPITVKSLVTTLNEKDLKAAKEKEFKWGNKVLNRIGLKQWTTTLCQELVREALTRLKRKNVRSTEKKQSTVRVKNYNPDLECDQFVYEVKGRGWCTPGTAGEKILGVPMKYGELPRLYGKPLKIILVGYQEYEARNHFAFGDLLDPKTQTPELRETLKYFKDHDIEYVGFTDILNQIGLSKGKKQKVL